MLRHLFILIWNKKRSHTLLIVEILASFMVLFGVLSLIIYNVRNYLQPLGYQYEHRWAIDFGGPGTTPDSINILQLDRIKAQIKSYPEVESVSGMSSNTPFSMNTINSGLEYNNASVLTYIFQGDEDLAKTLEIPVLEGRWFDKSDAVPDKYTAVINKPLKEALFGNEPAIGKTIEAEGHSYKIAGIIGNFKQDGEFADNEPGIFLYNTQHRLMKMIVHVKPGTDANFEAKLIKDLGSIAKDWTIEVDYLTDQRKTRHNLTLVPVIIFMVISGFLLANVALGLFGILKLNIGKRKEEIGLRRALGATARGISRQFVAEIWVLATFSILIGLLFAFQFPLLNVFDIEAGIYLLAIGISALAIYLLVTVCALYPSLQAATIQPAEALHEE
jgi:putative ABC transport system permease protein